MVEIRTSKAEVYDGMSKTQYESMELTKIENTPIILDVTYHFLIILKPRVPDQWAIAKNPEDHGSATLRNKESVRNIEEK